MRVVRGLGELGDAAAEAVAARAERATRDAAKLAARDDAPSSSRRAAAAAAKRATRDAPWAARTSLDAIVVMAIDREMDGMRVGDTASRRRGGRRRTVFYLGDETER